jgi:hypothetical protein
VVKPVTAIAFGGKYIVPEMSDSLVSLLNGEVGGGELKRKGTQRKAQRNAEKFFCVVLCDYGFKE